MKTGDGAEAFSRVQGGAAPALCRQERGETKSLFPFLFFRTKFVVSTQDKPVRFLEKHNKNGYCAENV